MPKVPSVVIRTVCISGLVLISGVASEGQRGPVTATRIPTTIVRGALADTTQYTLVRPDNWNGTVFVDLDTGNIDSQSSNWLYANGMARAGTTRDQVGSLMDHAADNLVETLDIFSKRFGAPKRAIVSGSSLGGQAAAVTAYKYPSRFVAALAHCGGLMGWSVYFNPKLDVAFALKTLLDPQSNLPLVHIPEETAPVAGRWTTLIETAQKTSQGRARIALAVALGQAPVWTTRTQPEPSATDAVGREEAAYRTLLDFSREFTALRRRLEVPAGGGTSWNTSVNYTELFDKLDATDRQTVEALYRQAALSLKADLGALDRAPRISPEPGPIEYVRKMYPFDGQISIPILTMSSTGDPYVWSAVDSAYVAAVGRAGRKDLLRLTYVHSAGHCAFSEAERVATYQVLIERLDSGRWADTTATAMNSRARAINLGEARFWDYKPPVLSRAAIRP